MVWTVWHSICWTEHYVEEEVILIKCFVCKTQSKQIQWLSQKFSKVMLEGKASVYILAINILHFFVVAGCGNRVEICNLSIYFLLEMFSGINKSHVKNRWPHFSLLSPHCCNSKQISDSSCLSLKLPKLLDEVADTFFFHVSK